MLQKYPLENREAADLIQIKVTSEPNAVCDLRLELWLEINE